MRSCRPFDVSVRPPFFIPKGCLCLACTVLDFDKSQWFASLNVNIIEVCMCMYVCLSCALLVNIMCAPLHTLSTP